MKYVKYIVMLTIPIIFLTCATTQINAIRNIEIPDIKLRNILVIAPFKDIGTRQATESAFLDCLERYTDQMDYEVEYARIRGEETIPVDVTFVRGIDLLPPFKEYSPVETMDRLKVRNVDGILAIGLEDFWLSQAYVPKSYETTSETRIYDNVLSHESYTQVYGGYYISKPRIKFEIRLYDVASGEVVWMATTVTKGNAFADYDDLVKSLTESVLKELIKEDIITKIEE